MSYAGLLNKTGTVTRATAATTGPEPTVTWATVWTGACRVVQRSGRELEGLHETAVTTHRVFFPLGADVTSDDRLTVDGVTYDLTLVTADAAGAAHHCEALARGVS